MQAESRDKLSESPNDLQKSVAVVILSQNRENRPSENLPSLTTRKTESESKIGSARTETRRKCHRSRTLLQGKCSETRVP